MSDKKPTFKTHQKECFEGKILNPETNRWVKKDGRVGRRLLKESQSPGSMGSGESKSGSGGSTSGSVQEHLVQVKDAIDAMQEKNGSSVTAIVKALRGTGLTKKNIEDALRYGVECRTFIRITKGGRVTYQAIFLPTFHDVSKAPFFEEIWEKQRSDGGRIYPIKDYKIWEFVDTTDSLLPGDIIYLGCGEAFDPSAYRPESYFYYVDGLTSYKRIVPIGTFRFGDIGRVIDVLNDIKAIGYIYSEESPAIQSALDFCRETFSSIWH